MVGNHQWHTYRMKNDLIFDQVEFRQKIEKQSEKEEINIMLQIQLNFHLSFYLSEILFK